MNLTKGQELALSAIAEVKKSHPDGGGVVRISGYAGTGKTTLLKTLAEGNKILVLTPTGKAAMRVTEVVGSRAIAMTVQRWLYHTTEDAMTGKLLTQVKDSVVLPSNDLIFIDEASMVTFDMYKDLYRAAQKFNLNLVYLGDGFQLPPVEFKENFKSFNIFSPDTPANYTVQMTEVVRQAQDNPVIKASMEIRDMRSDMETLSGLPTILIKDLEPKAAEVFNSGGATICHKNVTRKNLNLSIRKQLGIVGEHPQKGEPLMILQNNYGLDVYNGEIVTVLDQPWLLGDKPVAVTDRFRNESRNFWFYRTRIETPNGPASVSFADREVMGDSGNVGFRFIRKAGMDLSRTLTINDLRQSGQVLSMNDLNEITGLPVISANLGYALTAHKAQGSEFPTTLVCIEDSIRLHSPEGRRWLYTAVTRSKISVFTCWM
jgi:ATP-dependent exoDNAse (exonuclease V) alpha subunit